MRQSASRRTRPTRKCKRHLRAAVTTCRSGLTSCGGRTSTLICRAGVASCRASLELEAEADRESQQWGNRAGRYNGLYVLLGLPAAVLAAVAGVTVLASTAGRLAAGIVALMSAALSASATFLDSAKKRDQAAKLNTEWEVLYNEMRVCRLTLARFVHHRQRLFTLDFLRRACCCDSRWTRSGDSEKEYGSLLEGCPPSRSFIAFRICGVCYYRRQSSR